MTKKAKPVRAWALVNPQGIIQWWWLQSTRANAEHDFCLTTADRRFGWRVVRVEIREV